MPDTAFVSTFLSRSRSNAIYINLRLNYNKQLDRYCGCVKILKHENLDDADPLPPAADGAAREREAGGSGSSLLSDLATPPAPTPPPIPPALLAGVGGSDGPTIEKFLVDEEVRVLRFEV